MIRSITLVIFVFFTTVLWAQSFVLDTARTEYGFINFKANQIKLAEYAPNFKKVFKKLDTIAKGGKSKLHVFHIGGSHIQADIYSNRLRSYLQTMSPTATGQRGFIYPYAVASTNNPGNYRVEFDGKWEGYRCSVMRDSVAWGLSGVTAVFKDSIANITLKANGNNYHEDLYDFNKIRIFYDNWTDDYQISFKPDSLVVKVEENKEAYYTEYTFAKTVKEVQFCVQKVDSSANAEFLLMGAELMNDNYGVQYTSIGVNGASFAYYDRCAFFDTQLKLYKPDLFIISVGTNDAYHPDFDPEEYRQRYEAFIDLILEANPDCAVLLTVPNDSYYKRKFPNPRTRKARSIIYDVARKYDMAIWDFYEIMGGFNSSRDWYKQNLMPSDRIHFTVKGYRIKADLLLEAIAKAWENELQLETDSVLNQLINE
ncbi:GDSL-type esterase/lipase family protein [Aquimarina brevivitae]|uniref:GDSL-like lipase/acylhydrolase family protein n=1 Tax=Aquimarina brevivitae TaxID=323412 RepID=A0A4Q7PMC3_9FLAO|nr:GDSL-type esterase/lipase family protein [Aquimarina brevivitae]RZT00153.1 GDSL-like lipase/acylhydrolase family protein [Aquimarina brevivitae]